ncbi:sporulation protein YqfD [Paraliobacillus sp. X-1268]|uniref:sporulation protein YqfD n=1 Tax=Paraliobacillus sp. X-1268 TaxID=2213193 RepID=UPI000E3D00B8|nr:sporulation protein YqfD [Paraliobacillus sp. X-1268]
MKQEQGTWIRGYLTIHVIGSRPELFLDLCARNEIYVWDIHKIDKQTCVANIFVKDLLKIKKIRKKTRYKIQFKKRTGLPFTWKKFKKRKALMFGIVLSVLFVFFLSNMVWKIEIDGVRPEVEKQIRTSLRANGVYPGVLKFSVESPSKLQRLVLDNNPELLWVGVKEKGTTYTLEGVEKTTISEQEVKSPSNIVANKSGVIVDMYVSKGKPLVKINDFVEKGEILVAGDLKTADAIDEEKGEENEKEEGEYQIAAEAEIYANTWYESTISVPMEVTYQAITGEVNNKYYLGGNNQKVPIWGFFQEEYQSSRIEEEQNSIYFFQWELPIYFYKKEVYELEEVVEKRSEKEAKELGIRQAKIDLQETLGQAAEITNEKILHEASENGKVKLELYFTVKENIAKIQDLSQGD